MKKAKISLDIEQRKKMGIPIPKQDRILFLDKDITLPPISEKQIDVPVPWSFDTGLVEGIDRLPKGITVMNGICKTHKKGYQNVCPIIMANFSHIPVKIQAYNTLLRLTRSDNWQTFPIEECLNITNGRPRIEKIDHIDKIDLSHLPDCYVGRYKSLLRANADVFSGNDLNVGHCKSLPHKVRLEDSNRNNCH